MDTQTIINLGLGIMLAVGGWLAREIWSAIKTLQRDLQKLEVNLPSSYVSKVDFTEALREINVGLNRIFDKLDGKADK